MLNWLIKVRFFFHTFLHETTLTVSEKFFDHSSFEPIFTILLSLLLFSLIFQSHRVLPSHTPISLYSDLHIRSQSWRLFSVLHRLRRVAVLRRYHDRSPLSTPTSRPRAGVDYGLSPLIQSVYFIVTVSCEDKGLSRPFSTQVNSVSVDKISGVPVR